MKGLTRKTITTMFLSVALLAAAGGAFASVQYFLGAYEERLRADMRMVHEAQVANRQSASLESLLAETAADRQTLASFVLTESGISDFLSEVEQVGARFGLAARTLSVAAREADQNGFGELIVELEVIGSVDQIERMTEALDLLPYQVLVERAVLNRGGGEGANTWRGVLYFTVTTASYESR
jgi:Tfp pilus assembly protein PilO